MTRDEKIARAIELRRQGWTYESIGGELGCSWGTIYYWLNPEYAKRQNEKRKKRRADDPEYVERQIEQRRQLRANPVYRMNEILNRSIAAATKHNYAPCGATVEDLLLAYGECGGCCEKCGTPESELNGNLVLDHCHTTGAFRGFLCPQCNLAIGGLGDTPEEIYAAFTYLDPDRAYLHLMSRAT